MTETFDWAGLFREAHGAAWADGTGDAFHAAGEYLRERIEAAFVPVEHHVSVIADHDELLQREIARAEAAEAKCVKLWALLDDIDTLDDACRGDDDLFRTLTRAAQQKRHAIMSGKEWDTARAALGGEHDRAV